MLHRLVELSNAGHCPQTTVSTGLVVSVMIFVMITGMITASAVQLGDVASWIGGIATSAALFLTYGLLKVTRRDQREFWAEQRQAQARKTSAWCERVEAASGLGPDTVTVRLRNASDEPIYSVRLAVGADWWNSPPEWKETDIIYVVAPDSRPELTLKLRLDRTVSGEVEPSPPVEIIFSDAGGTRFWRRDRFGGLSEIPGSQPPAVEKYFFANPTNQIQSRRTAERRRRIGPIPLSHRYERD
jgi:hypothetical protein